MLYYPNATFLVCAATQPLAQGLSWPGLFGLQCNGSAADLSLAWSADASAELLALASGPQPLVATIYKFQAPLPDTPHTAGVLAMLVQQQIIGMPQECSVPVARIDAWSDSLYTTAAGIIKHSPTQLVSLSFFETYMPLHIVTVLCLLAYLNTYYDQRKSAGTWFAKLKHR